MQLSAAWRGRWAVARHDLAGGPGRSVPRSGRVHAPALGLRESERAAVSPHLRLSHIAAGVVTGSARGPLSLEASFFRVAIRRTSIRSRGRMPDSWSARAWFRPRPEWTIQVSHGFLHEPDSWTWRSASHERVGLVAPRTGLEHFTAATVSVGRTARTFSTVRAALLELRGFGRTSLTAVETSPSKQKFFSSPVVHRPHPGELVDPVRALTIGAVRDLVDVRGFKLGLGGDVVFHRVPDAAGVHARRERPLGSRVPSPAPARSRRAHVEHDDGPSDGGDVARPSRMKHSIPNVGSGFSRTYTSIVLAVGPPKGGPHEGFECASTLQLEGDGLLHTPGAVAVVDPGPLDAGGAGGAGHPEHTRADPGSARRSFDAQESAERGVGLSKAADGAGHFRSDSAPGAVNAIDTDLCEGRGDRPGCERGRF